MPHASPRPADVPGWLAYLETLHPKSIEKVNIPRIWSLVTCIKD